MKKLLLILLLLPFFQPAQAQEEIVKWTFPTGQLSDTMQNGTNPLNLTRLLTVMGAGPITMTNGQTGGDYAATASNWDDGMNTKYWLAKFKTTGYDNVKISYKQRAGGSNGGPGEFKLQYRFTSTGTWNDVPNSELTLGNDWFTGVITDLDLPADCQNQSATINVRWVMTSNNDVNGGSVSASGISKIDDIIVTGMLITGLDEGIAAEELYTFPNPSAAIFNISVPKGTTSLEIFSNNGQSVYKSIPENNTVRVEKELPAGIYFVKTIANGKVSMVKHIVR